jgi:hypothetical protein
MDQVTLTRAEVQQALHVATAAAYPMALIATLRAALEQPARPLCKGIPRRGCNYLAPCDTVCNKCGEIHHHYQMVAQFQAAQQPEQEQATVKKSLTTGEQPEQEPVADRAAFERHAESLGYSVDLDTRAGREGGYWSSHTHLMWETWQAALEQTEQEPFGYFRAEPCGWTDCSETDEGAKPLYEKPPTTWTPATTPPDTERTVLAWVNGEWFSAWYYARDRQWMDACVGATIENVTHWMDPTPPTTTTQPEPK